MSGLTAEQVRMMRHAVGQRWHRNHYVVSKGTDDEMEWVILLRDGLAREFHNGICICVRTFHVTESGIAALKAHESQSEESTDG